MTPDFFNSIVRTDEMGEPVSELQNLFINMKYGHSPPSTKKLMDCLRIQSGKQQDVEEHFRILISNIPEDMRVREMFIIQMVNSIICQECQEEDIIPNPMLTLPVSIQKPQPSVGEAVQDFLKPNVLCGDNQCYCIKCKSKQDAISCNYFAALPQILVIHLKRYEIFSGGFRKINQSVDVPNTLNIPMKNNSDGCDYKLFALCHHYGGLKSGHYTSEIKSFVDDQWYIFDDTHVTMSHSGISNEKSSDTAYLLMYYKEQPYKPMFLEKEHLSRELQSRILRISK
ncbi:ubl carboxyl-terminal hydrolase 18-like isoform X2 [Ambystoma mexicanum]